MENRIYSVDSAKAVKAQAYGYLNAIHYLAPSNLSGINLCPHASPGCINLCLGEHSGQAGMVSHDTDMNATRLSRRAKARRFMRERARYLLDMIRATDNVIAAAARKQLIPCVRPNGSSDIAWEGIRFSIERNAKGKAIAVKLGGKQSIFDHYAHVQFVDYTKNPRRFDRVLPVNYCLTFSRSETNEPIALELLGRGVNVAAVFAGDKPATWRGFDVIDGDKHDLRQLDPRGARGVVIGLSPKGRKAARDTSGFVIRNAA